MVAVTPRAMSDQSRAAGLYNLRDALRARRHLLLHPCHAGDLLRQLRDLPRGELHARNSRVLDHCWQLALFREAAEIVLYAV